MNQTRRKILYIITKSNWGGAQRHVFDLASNLPKSKFEPIVAAGGNGPLHEKLREAGIRSIPIESLERDIKTSKEASSFITFWRLIQNEKPAIIHLHSPKAGGLGALTARLHNTYSLFLHLLNPKRHPLNPARIIYTVHGWPFNEDRSAKQKFLIKLISWLTVCLVDRTIVISDRERLQAKNFPFVQSKIVRIYNGIKSKINFTEKSEARKIISETIADPKNIWIGTVAELHKNKGLNFAIEAWPEVIEKFPKAKLIIIGEGEDRQNLEKKVELYGLGNSVFLAGRKDNASHLLKAFDLFLLPSIKEGLPYVVLEAGAACLPTIATSVGGLTEIIDDMKSGILIQAKNPGEISKAISYLLEQNSIAIKMAKALKSKINKTFTLKQMTQGTYAEYD